MPEVVVFCLRAVVLVLLWGFVAAAVIAVRHDVFGTRTAATPRRAAPPAPAPKPARRGSKPAGARQLVVVDGAEKGTAVALSSLPVTIGRAADSTLVLSDDYTSNHHARLSPRGNEWVLEDTGSTNGTFVAGRKVTSPVTVGPGVQITIGRTSMELRS